MSAFYALIRAAFRRELEHRSRAIARVFGTLVDILARISIWQAVFAGHASMNGSMNGSMSGISLGQMITYALIGGTILSSWDATMIVRDVGGTIRTGAIGSSLLRPMAYPVMLLAEQLGTRLFDWLMTSLPVIVIMGLIYGIEPPASAGHALLFLGFVLVSLAVMMLFGILIGLFSFWVFDAHSLEWFMRGLLGVFSGGLVPIWFFPKGLAEVAHVLPFAWITYHPMTVYLGERDLASSALYLLAGGAWAAVLALAVSLVWSRACGQVVVQGG
ncbi:ABC-2 family transporter protein [Rhizobium sp. SSA_523]|uniref:ABC transporter permease n=1 Tax=Rhizobium sp. SSA_523 TaxID=2952477 RepID=UPI0020918E29|nr:ABC-2 family transporter protein [Rhizobium sp. SSA_523]MCO5733549.1 ABC-2 family transporter protein [Rhizobium sp. SSA_523]WKC23148.1 ABC-2 family transporter protein [Rhizobium sp. SSA_523]